MIIDIKKLVPDQWMIDDRDRTYIKVFYLNKGRGSHPKPFVLPRKISINEQFIEAVGMYLGDGKLSSDMTHLGFSSIDPEMVKFILDFFLKRLNIGLKDFHIALRLKEYSKKTTHKWAEDLCVKTSKIHTQLTNRSRNPSCEIQLSGKIFRILFEKILEHIKKSDFLYDKKLRRAFLRGLFAAEGCIGINRHQNYIVSCQFCLGTHEKELILMLKKALEKEKITFHENFKENTHSYILQITNWINYHKLWKIDLFRLNKRKEYKFLSKLKITKFSCKLSHKLKKRLFAIDYFSTRQLAFLLGVVPSALKQKKEENVFLNVELLINLSKLSSTPLKEIKKNILEFRVNDVITLDDKNFIDFIFDLKSYCL